MGSATVVLGLIAAATWGSGDFSGGLLARRAPILGVVLVSQVVGTAIAFVLALGLGETLPLPGDIPWSISGGILGGLGILALYRGLAIGKMGVVAPVSGVVGATIPVAFEVLLEGLPTALVMLGIGLAVAAVVLVSRVDDGRSGPSGLGLALFAGITLGAFGIALSQISDGHVFGPLAIIRGTEGLLIGGIVVLGRQAWRANRRLLPAMAGVGILDMAGNGAYILAIHAGSLAIAAVLSSLYPVTTVLLASVVLHERITRSHAAGIALAASAIACIAAGSS